MTHDTTQSLAQLVADARADLGLSFRDVERAAGGAVKASTVHKVERGERASVEPRTLAGLAKGLRIPITTLRAANGQTGLVPREAFVLPDRLNALTAKQRRLLITLGDALLEAGHR